MKGETLIPTNARQAWQAGASAEARARDAGLSLVVRQVREYVVALGRSEPTVSRDELVDRLAFVYTADRPLRARLRLAWQIVSRRR